MSDAESTLEGIAIIGLSGRFPGAPNVAAFWRNLLNGEESIATVSSDKAKEDGDLPPPPEHSDDPEDPPSSVDVRIACLPHFHLLSAVGARR